MAGRERSDGENLLGFAAKDYASIVEAANGEKVTVSMIPVGEQNGIPRPDVRFTIFVKESACRHHQVSRR